MDLLLGIETSCDETSASLVEDARLVLCNVTQTSARDFTDLGGIVPEMAARKQLLCMLPVLDACFRKAHKGWQDVRAIAVTKGPGLIGSLIVGVATARVLSKVFRKPLIGVHHTLGHLCSTWLVEKSQSPNPNPQPQPEPEPQFPILTLSVSGGHTELWYRTDHLRGGLLGQTLDDAAGEAFDKGAVLLGLPFPGGPALSRLAEGGNPRAYNFPLPLKKEPGTDFSFSGLKTALKYLLRDLPINPSTNKPIHLPDLAASYQEAICNHLIDRVRKALHEHPETRELHLVGGVAANKRLREMLNELLEKSFQHMRLTVPAKMEYCTDNAAMIAAAGYVLWKHRKEAEKPFTTAASMELSEINHTTI